VDSEIRAIITDAHNKATDILNRHRPLLDKLSQVLQEKETLGTEDIFRLILEDLGDEDRAMVDKKFARAREMRFEHSQEESPEVATSVELDDNQEEQPHA